MPAHCKEQLQHCPVVLPLPLHTPSHSRVPYPLQVLRFAIDAVKAEAFNPKTLFLFGSYTIGGLLLPLPPPPPPPLPAGMLHHCCCHHCQLPWRRHLPLAACLTGCAALCCAVLLRPAAGKERLFLEAARVLQRKIYVSVAKRKARRGLGCMRRQQVAHHLHSLHCTAAPLAPTSTGAPRVGKTGAPRDGKRCCLASRARVLFT